MGRNETERYFGSALGLMWKLNAFFGSASRLQWIDVHKQWFKLSRTRSCFGGDLWLIQARPPRRSSRDTAGSLIQNGPERNWWREAEYIVSQRKRGVFYLSTAGRLHVP